MVLRDTDSHGEVVPSAPPAFGEVSHDVANLQRHPHRPLGGVVALNRVVEEHHDPVAREPLERPFVGVDERPDGAVILAEHPHHLLGFAGLREGGEVPEIGEQHHDFAPMACEQVLVTDHDFGQLWG